MYKKISFQALNVYGNNFARLLNQSISEEIVKNMKKLDAQLVAYLASEINLAEQLSGVIEKKELNNFQFSQATAAAASTSRITSSATFILPDNDTHERKLETFKTIRCLKLEMEALTLESHGIKRMELLETEIRPIFTVECQLSQELIKNVPHYDMFHVMQFESEKFNKVTQCTRFGQYAQREIQLVVDEGKNSKLNLGSIYFTVWWREPGTCLNEMLGIGSLNLVDLYYASLVEQCKRIKILRRGYHMASLYFKITLQRGNMTATYNNSSTLITKAENDFFKQSVHNSNDLPSNRDKIKTAPTQQEHKQQQQQQQKRDICKNSDTTIPTTIPNGADDNGNFTSIDPTIVNHSVNAQEINLESTGNNFDIYAMEISAIKGFIYANEMRNIEEMHGIAKTLYKKKLFLLCRRFWHDEPIITVSDNIDRFNYQEDFFVINDDQFLKRTEKQYLDLELWQLLDKIDSSTNDNGDGGISDIDNFAKKSTQLLGVVHIPLHPFFIAFRNAHITDRMCKGKLPVISIDAWTSITNDQNNCQIGEMRCLLAMGSDNQIKNFKMSRGFKQNLTSPTRNKYLIEQDNRKVLRSVQNPLISASDSTMVKEEGETSSITSLSSSSSSTVKQTSHLLNVLQKALTTANQNTNWPSSSLTIPSVNNVLLKPLQQANIKLFKFILEIQNATNLPLNPAGKVNKNGMRKQNISKRFPPNEAPSCYVTFQADDGQYPTYKSYEGTVFATKIVKKSTQPQWQQRFRLAVNIDYLHNLQKRFILKVWKKSLIELSDETHLEPTPLEDAIIGFAALDFTVFLKGLDINGCFNIVDFNGRINGQLCVHCQPLEDVKILLKCNNKDNATPVAACTVDAIIDQFEESFDLTHLNLNQAIKRKFNELENISERLRARLGDIAGATLPTEFNYSALDKWQKMKEDELNDNREIYEFQQFLNTPYKTDEKNSHYEYSDHGKCNKNIESKQPEESVEKPIQNTSGTHSNENTDYNE